jgi:hypothetical protein
MIPSLGSNLQIVSESATRYVADPHKRISASLDPNHAPGGAVPSIWSIAAEHVPSADKRGDSDMVVGNKFSLRLRWEFPYGVTLLFGNGSL